MYDPFFWFLPEIFFLSSWLFKSNASRINILVLLCLSPLCFKEYKYTKYFEAVFSTSIGKASNDLVIGSINQQTNSRLSQEHLKTLLLQEHLEIMFQQISTNIQNALISVFGEILIVTGSFEHLNQC